MSQPFSYLSLTHGAVAGACLLIALMHVMLLARSARTNQRVVNNITVATMALAAGAATLFELEKALATDVDVFLAGLYGEAISAFVLLVAVLVFTRSYFELAVDSLFVAAMSVWIASNIYQIGLFPESFYTDVHDLLFRETPWGERYAKLDATVSGFKYFADFGSLLVFAYTIKATISGIRRDQSDSAIIVGGALVGFMLVAGTLVPLDDEGLVSFTMPIGLPFLAIVAALTYQLIDDRIQISAVRLEVEQLRRNSLAGEIAAGLMHELRQPLTSMLSNAQAARRFLAQDRPDLEEVRDALDDVVSEDKRAAGIISGLRTFLKQEALETSEFDLNSSVRHVSRMLAGEFKTSGTRVALSLHPTPVPIDGSDVQIEQVLINLALNSLRALREQDRGDRAIRFTTMIIDGAAAFSVSDSGPGIPSDLHDRLFEPFMSGNEDGLGMGLAICRRIVDSHEGTICVEDSELGGARFAVILPLAEAKNV